jgi:Flp pilus assembly protein TadD
MWRGRGNCFKRLSTCDLLSAGCVSSLGRSRERAGTKAEPLQVDSGNAQALQAWAVLEKEEKNIGKAVELLERCLQLFPKHESALHALAKIEIEQRHFVRARTLLQRALVINPSHAHSWTTLGELCYIQGDPVQARSVFTRMIASCGADSVLYATWGGMEAKMADHGAPWDACAICRLHSYCLSAAWARDGW